MPRKTIIAGNWKMNLLPEEAETLIFQLRQNCRVKARLEVIVIPQMALLPIISELTTDTSIQLGSQNSSSYLEGAYTGETSPALLKVLGCTYGLVGHSERRANFGESDELVGQKAATLTSMGISPIVCVGESLDEREAGQFLDIIKQQISVVFEQVEKEDWPSLIFAYEPVWAIGTGKTATPEQANEVHQFIRQTIRNIAGEIVAESTCVLYGGSAKPENAKELLSESDIDGLLVGGASLKAEDFSQMIYSI